MPENTDAEYKATTIEARDEELDDSKFAQITNQLKKQYDLQRLQLQYLRRNEPQDYTNLIRNANQNYNRYIHRFD